MTPRLRTALALVGSVLVAVPALAGPGGRMRIWLDYTDGSGNRSLIGPRADGPEAGSWIYSFFPVPPDRSGTGRETGEESGIHALTRADVERLRAAVAKLEAKGTSGHGTAMKGTGRFEVIGTAGAGTGPMRRFRVSHGPALSRFDAQLRRIRRSEGGVAIDRTGFRVVRAGDEDAGPWYVRRQGGRSWPVPPLEKAIPDEPDPQWNPVAHAIPLQGGSWLVHLSSYEIQGRNAMGRDRFLVLGPSSRVIEIAPSAEPTLGRGEHQGCRTAEERRYYVADVDGDGRLDLGVERRGLRCREGGRRLELHVSPLMWYRQQKSHWRVVPEYEGRRPEDAVRLPWIGLERGPVETIQEAMND